MSLLSPLPAKDFTPEAAARLLWRAGFGCTWTEAVKTADLGLDSAVDRLVFYGPANPSMPACAALPEESPRAFQVRMKNLPDDESRQAARRLRNETERSNIQALKIWWLQRMLASSLFEPGIPPLEEKLTLFWHSHFASSFEDKIESTTAMWRQNQLLRTFALESFPNQLDAIIHDPAMLVWLDNASSQKGRPNENFARELMELFSMGVGQYSEQDVKESARALTGYSVNRETWEFEFREAAHDSGEKTFLGLTGPLRGEDIVTRICEHPCTADFLSRKLLTEFVCAQPPQEWISSVATLYRDSGYHLKEVLRTIFRSSMFYSEEARNAVVKSPVVLAIGALKSMREDLPSGPLILGALRVMGQDLFFPPDVNGWPGGSDWINSNTLLVRYNFANFLMHGVSPDEFGVYDRKVVDRGPGRRAFLEKERNPDAVNWDPQTNLKHLNRVGGLLTSSDVVDFFLAEFLQRTPSAELRKNLIQLAETDGAGGRRPLSVSDSNFNERIRGLVHLIMSSPEYQLC
jgi:uncharacterized protein (DUF1800 family)